MMSRVLLFTKKFDKSSWFYGMTLPNDAVSRLTSLGIAPAVGGGVDITINLNGTDFVQKLTNTAFDKEKYPGHKEIWRVLWHSSPMMGKLRELFPLTAAFYAGFAAVKEVDDTDDSKKPKLPEAFAGTIDFFIDTEDATKWYAAPHTAQTAEDRHLRDEVTVSPESHFWIYAPGENACCWDEFRDAGIMALDYDLYKDLRDYKNTDELKETFQKMAGDTASHKNDVRALWDFLKNIKPGDIVFAKKGTKTFVGVGIVEGNYYCCSQTKSMCHRRKVNWFNFKQVEVSDKVAIKTLTDITPYPFLLADLADKYELDNVRAFASHRIWDEFLAKWPLSKLKSMTLAEYISLGGKESFCYWLETKMVCLGSISGGSAYKFGIFEFNKTNPKEVAEDKGALGDDKYRWYAKYGQTAEEAFQNVRQKVADIAEASSRGDLNQIEFIDFSPAVKWKIAFLYQSRENLSVIDIYKKEMLAKGLGVSAGMSMAELNAKAIAAKPDGVDVFVWARSLWTGTGLPTSDSSSDSNDKNIDRLDSTDLSLFMEYLRSKGLTYKESFVRRFFAALQAKNFVVLTGLSGSGKTQLALKFCEWMAPSHFRMVPVGADWTNNEKMLGYPDAIRKGSYVRPDTGVLDLVLDAAADKNGSPYILLLDEMNLSHVERYFADFLSAMESHEELMLHGMPEPIDGIPGRIRMPSNLWVIGTMNVDETTYMFSPKVLDRAQVLEFRVSEEEMNDYLGDGVADAALRSFFPKLSAVGAEFGYRTAREFKDFVAAAEKLGSSSDEAIDAAIMQKLLPKLHGSKRKLIEPLKALKEICEGKYPVSLAKIERMIKAATEVGFASFAEA